MALTGWGNQFLLIIDSNKYSDSVSNVTVVVHLSTACGLSSFDASEIFTELGSSYLKMAAELDGSGAEINIEVERWDATAKVAVLHIGPVSVTTGNHIITLWYDSNHADNTSYVGTAGSTAGESAWDSNSNVVANLAQDPSGTPPQIVDSTANSNDGSSNGTMTSGDLVTTDHGYALDFDGSDDDINFGDLGAIPDAGTIELLIKLNSVSVVNGCFTTRYNASGNNELRLQINSTTAYVVFNTTAYSFATLAADTYYLILISWDKTSNNYIVMLNGSEVKNASNTAWPTTFPDVRLGVAYNTTYRLGGIVDFLRISDTRRTKAWGELVHHAFIDNLLTITGLQPVKNGLLQVYGAGPVDPNGLFEIYGLLHDPAIAGLVQLYNIFYGDVQNALAAVYGINIAIGLRQPYGNAYRLRKGLVQRYGNAPVIMAALLQRYGDTLKLKVGFAQAYHIYDSVVNALAQRYSLTAGEVVGALAHYYDIQSLQAPITGTLAQPYGLLGSFAVKQYAFGVTVAGIALTSVTRITVTEDINQYLIRAEITLADQGEFAMVGTDAALTIQFSGITYSLFVAEKSRARARDLTTPEIEYRLVGLSLTAGLDLPRGVPLTKDWPVGAMASEIVAELAEGYTVDWQMLDWPIKGGTLFANNESRLEVIRKIIRERGKLQTAPDGTLRVVPEYAVSPPAWPMATPDYTLSELDDLFTGSESWDERDGTNAVLVSDQNAADESLRMEQEQVDGSRTYIRGYRVPWNQDFTIHHSGGSWIEVQSFGVVSEPHTEQVEFIDGRAQVLKPLYSLTAVSWLQVQLGAVTPSEDGSLVSEIEGNSLASITYISKCRKWLARDERNEDVQFYLEVA